MRRDEIIKEVFSSKPDLMFNPEELNSLNDNDRLMIEKKIINLLKNGNDTSYRYLPYFKNKLIYKDLELLINDLSDYDKALIYYYMFKKNSDIYYLNKICLLSRYSIKAYSLLILLYSNMNNNEKLRKSLFSMIIKIPEKVDEEKKELYNQLINKRIDIHEYDNIDNNDDNLMFVLADEIDANQKQIIINNLITQKEKIINKQRKKSIRDSLYGLIVGDAFGVPYEFSKRNSFDIDEKMVGYGNHDQPAGTWSDDTSMTLATIDSINQTIDIDYDNLMNSFCKWLFQKKYTATGVVFDVGISTSIALRKYVMEHLDPLLCGNKDIASNGNGALMRMMPICFYLATKSLEDDLEINIINNVSSLTHAHEISKLGCFIYYQYMKNILNGMSKENAYKEMCSYDYSKKYTLDALNYYERLLNSDIQNESIDNIKSSGFIVHTLEAAIWVILNSESYQESIIKAVKLGDDTDTVGAVTGSIAGIIYGYHNIPENWINELPKRNFIDNLIEKYDDKILNNTVVINKKIT